MGDNLAQEIREHEEKAREIVTSAKSDASRLLARCRSGIEKSCKENRQRLHRSYRDSLQKAEAEAEAAAVSIVTAGREQVDKFKEAHSSQAAATSKWIVKEVMGAYGLN